MQDDYVTTWDYKGDPVRTLRYGGADGKRKVTSKLEILQISTDIDSIRPKRFVVSVDLFRDLKYQYLLDSYRSFGSTRTETPGRINGILIEIETSDRSMPTIIGQFRNEYFFLSNFYSAPVEIDGMAFLSSEHAYQAYKATNLEDAIHIRDFVTPTVAKQVGRRIKMRPDWEQIKLAVMREVVFAKFFQNKGLAELLDATGGMVLVEGNTWGDRFWGTVNNEGQNHLGRILMDVRQDLRRMKNA